MRGKVSPSNFVEIFSLIFVHGTLDSAEASIMIVVQGGWYFEIPDLTVVQEPA